jgi:hypothetical protein
MSRARILPHGRNSKQPIDFRAMIGRLRFPIRVPDTGF